MNLLSEVFVLVSSICLMLSSPARTPLSSGARSFTGASQVTIPFERVNKNICLQVSVANSKPLSFILDTGAKYAVIDLAVAKSLGLEFGDQVAVGGAGKNVTMGNFLKNSSFRIVGLENFSQPLSLAIPFDELAKASGHEFAGILGYDFISQFVVEVDYIKQAITLLDKDHYKYRGPGEIFAISFNAASHPQLHARIIDGERAPIEGTFVLDLGSSASVILNKPLVAEQQFLRAGRPTVSWLEGRGLGGIALGSVGRIQALELGSYQIKNPVAIFSRADSGPLAVADVQGNIGAAILEKFKVILDYVRNRVILEPNSRLAEPMEYNRSGLFLVSFGANYREYKIASVAENSPASESALQVADILLSINGRPASDFSLTEIRRLFQEAGECDLQFRRGDAMLRVKLKLRRLI
jgi:hypothetical protein